VKKGGRIMETFRQEVRTFAAACEQLLGHEITPAVLTNNESHMIQYFLAALAVKFAALSDLTHDQRFL
jgi:hypothetical protein